LRIPTPRVLVIVLFAAACQKASGPGPVGNDSPNLPCDVRDVLANACATCHTNPPNSASKVPLESRDDFLAGSVSVDGKTVAEVAAARLHDATNPMPPLTEVPLSAGQLATLDAWLATADLADGACDPLPSPPAATTCPSATMWTMGTTGDMDMTPGQACKTCHAQNAPTANYAFQGTVFTDFHTADDCDAPPPGNSSIEILDMAGNVTKTLIPGLSGNFTSFDMDDPDQAPYRARLVVGDLKREMSGTHTSTDCNACHTEQGKNAFAATNPDDPAPPGRIVWPSARPD
jgi:hypothetical protein